MNEPQQANLEAALLRGELDRVECMLRRVTQALGDLSFECFGGIGTCTPSVDTYNRTFGVLEEARAYGGEQR
jgi:hypothetical protein